MASFQKTCWKLFQQIVTSLQMTSSNKPDFNRLLNLMKLTSLLELVDKLQQAGKIENLQQVCGAFRLCSEISIYDPY